MTRLKIANNGSYFLVLSMFYIVSPIICLMISLLFYKKTVSQFFFVAFAFYFGYQIGANLDLMNHYNNYKTFFGRSFFDMYSDLVTLHLGKEPFHISLKYILSRFYVSQRVFSATVCALYSIAFIYYIRQFKDFYLRKIDSMRLLVLMVMAVTIEFYWYFGVRFWLAGFIFMIFYCKYILTGKKRYIFLTALSALFHVVLITATLVVIAVEFTRNNRILQFSILLISFIYKNIEFGLMKILSGNQFVQIFYKDAYQKSNVQRAIVARAKEYYEHGNMVYQNRTPMMLLFFFFMIFLLWTRNKDVLKSYPKMFGCVLMMLALSNFFHSDFVFYERFIKLTCLIGYSYLFLILFDKKNQWICNSIYIKVCLFGIVILSLLISCVQERQILSEMLIWFGNFFFPAPMQEIPYD